MEAVADAASVSIETVHLSVPTFRSLIWPTGEYRNHGPRLILSGFLAAEGVHGLIAEFLVWTTRLRRFYGTERNMHWKCSNLSRYSWRGEAASRPEIAWVHGFRRNCHGLPAETAECKP
jgi:hypothetical protein